jgi:type I restriction enzyme S subunit
MSNGLPKGWAETPIQEIAEVFLGKTPGKGDYESSGSLKVVKFRDIQNGLIDFQNTKDGFVAPNAAVITTLRELQRGDVLITSAAHSGENIGKKCAFVSSLPAEFERVFFTGELLNVRCREKTLSRWAYLFFRSADGFEEIQEAVKGVHLTSGRARLMIIPFAPLNEQLRIVAKLEKLLGRVDACQKRLAKIPTLLKRFRQSVLAAACSGRLTADWREDDIYQNDFPVTWTICKVSDISTLITKGASPKWQGVNYAENGVLFVTSENVGLGKMLLDTKKFVESKINEIQPRSVLQNGDVLTNIVGASIGRSAIFDRDDVANINQAVALIRLTNAVNRKYILHVLNSPVIIEHMESEKVDVARANLSLKDVGNYPIPLPPLNEQEEVVRRVEALFALADQIEARFGKAKARVDQITQSLLAKAFRGELVPQNPNDEPASALLERIKAERAKREMGIKGKQKERKKNKK